jgi:hypothetical protein
MQRILEMATGHEFQPVQGDSIPVSAKKAIWFVGLGLAITPLGLVLMWLWWSDTTIPVIEKQVSWWGALLGVVATVSGILLPPLVLWQWLVRKERLVIGADYLQIVISKGGKDFVKTQIAFKNIESASVTKHFDNKVVAILIRDIHAPDLVSPGADELTKFEKSFGFHLYLEDIYQLPARDVCRRIEKAVIGEAPQ